MKLSLEATSSNHSYSIALHEATCECSWLLLVDGFIRGPYGFPDVPTFPTIIYKDNATYIA